MLRSVVLQRFIHPVSFVPPDPRLFKLLLLPPVGLRAAVHYRPGELFFGLAILRSKATPTAREPTPLPADGVRLHRVPESARLGKTTGMEGQSNSDARGGSAGIGFAGREPGGKLFFQRQWESPGSNHGRHVESFSRASTTQY
jgi:hypothetical protein